ncbi:uncharacterized protein isoform X2 [Rhodnius prolixus]|uniref:uncharacterized protein isoform X2 n=1 Tax=Rhodnius prolixus TaxID=13249 RepID=UPI003D18C633
MSSPVKQVKSDFGAGSVVNNVYGVSVDQPLDAFLAKRKLQQPLDPEECQAYMPFTFDKVSPSEIFLENDIRIRDSAARSAQPSTLTSMLPLKPVPVKKKESEWGSYQDMSCDYSTNPQSPGTYRSMMTRFRDAMIIAKIPTFRTEALID